jgi:hypothetical protein
VGSIKSSLSKVGDLLHKSNVSMKLAVVLVISHTEVTRCHGNERGRRV